MVQSSFEKNPYREMREAGVKGHLADNVRGHEVNLVSVDTYEVIAQV